MTRGNPVDIVGAGPDATIIVSSVAAVGVAINEPTSTMSQLQVKPTSPTNYAAIQLDGTIDDVKVRGTPGSSLTQGVG